MLGQAGPPSQLTRLVCNMENICGKLNNFSFMNYFATMDIACLTETFADSTFDFNGLSTEYEKICCFSKKKKKTSTRQTSGWSVTFDLDFFF